jgi:hypothetical protein
MVVPNPDAVVVPASCHQMLLQAYVKSIYFAGVERVNEEFVL